MHFPSITQPFVAARITLAVFALFSASDGRLAKLDRASNPTGEERVVPFCGLVRRLLSLLVTSSRST